jgi:hypothetical protein
LPSFDPDGLLSGLDFANFAVSYKVIGDMLDTLQFMNYGGRVVDLRVELNGAMLWPRKVSDFAPMLLTILHFNTSADQRKVERWMVGLQVS